MAVSKNENIFPPKKNPTTASQSLSCAAGKSLGDFFERNDVLNKMGFRGWRIYRWLKFCGWMICWIAIKWMSSSTVVLDPTELDIFLLNQLLSSESTGQSTVDPMIVHFYFFEIQSFVLSGPSLVMYCISVLTHSYHACICPDIIHISTLEYRHKVW